MRCRYLFIFVLCFSGLKGQRRIILDEIWKNQIFENPYLLKDSLDNFTKTKLEFHFEEPNFKRVQTPEKSQTFFFENKGIFVEKSWKMSGFFNLSHQKEYGLGYNLSDERTRDKSYLTPYYYYVLKKSDWKNQGVVFGANVSRSFFQNEYVSQLKLTGHWNGYARLSDPRPKITNLDYSTEILLGKRILNGLFSLKYGLAHHDKNLNYYYENQSLNHINYPETFLRFNEGFGNQNIYTEGQQEHVFHQNRTHFGVEYITIWNHHFLQMDYITCRSQMKVYDGAFVDGEKERFLTNEQTNRAEIIFHSDSNNHLYTQKWFWNQRKGTNYNNRTHYRSFSSYEQNVGIASSFANEENSGGVSITYQNLKLNDGSVKIKRNNENLFLKFFWKYRCLLSQNQNMEIKPSSDFFLPLGHTIDYQPFNSKTNNDFVENVIFKDFEYDTHFRMSLGLRLSLNYAFKKKIFSVFADFKNDYYLGKIETKNKNRGFSLNTGIHVYY